MKNYPNYKSRNFTVLEVTRKKQYVNSDDLLLSGYMWGYVQAIRDAAANYFGSRFKGLRITSSNRAWYNSDVPNAASNSHHIWRVEDDTQEVHVAVDVIPIGVGLEEFYVFVSSTFKGEIYLNKEEGIVHIAPVPMEDEHWIQ